MLSRCGSRQRGPPTFGPSHDSCAGSCHHTGRVLHDAWTRPNGDRPTNADDHVSTAQVRSFHRRLGGYEPSAVVRLSDAEEKWGVGDALVKYERSRLGLPSFKALGASWATYRSIVRELGLSVGEVDEQWDDLEGLRAVAARLGPTTLVTATDGNHGRAVARMARLLGLSAHVLVPIGTANARLQAIADEGAVVHVVDGDYDEAVQLSAHIGLRPGHLLVSDTSWPGYEEVPGWISDGYATMLAEIAEQVDEDGLPDAVLVPVGVGALALAVLRHYVSRRVPVIAVEPVGADCVTASLRAGRLTTVPGPHPSMMAGLNCGTASVLAWPALSRGLAGSLVITDDVVEQAMLMLAVDGLAVGETGAAGAAALLALRRHPDVAHCLGIGPSARVLLLCTEGVTDPENYRQVVGRDPQDVDPLSGLHLQ